MKKRKLIAGMILALVLASQAVVSCTAESSISEEIIADLDTQESLLASEPNTAADPSGTAAGILPEAVMDSAVQETAPVSGTDADAEEEIIIDLEDSGSGSEEGTLYDEETYGQESSDESISTNPEEETDLTSELTIEEEELSTDSLELEDYAPAPVSSSAADLPDYDIWMANTMIDGFMGEQTPLYSLFTSFQDPVYRELGGYVLEDKSLAILSTAWSAFFNSEYRSLFANNKKYIYEVILMNYLTYEAEEGNASAELSNNEMELSTKMYALLADELEKDIEDYVFKIPIEKACSLLSKAEVIKGINNAISLVQFSAETTDELVQMTAQCLALQKAREERIALLKAAKNACGSSNRDFAEAVNDIIKILQSGGTKYAADQSLKIQWKMYCGMLWEDLVDLVPELALIDVGIAGLDVCFDSTNTASNNLKLALLYTVDNYMKKGMANIASAFSRSKTSQNGQKFMACFQAYAQFQIFGNTYARTWLEDYLDGGVFSDLINNLFYRDNIRTAKELLSRIDSQTSNRQQMLKTINVYAEAYEKLYGNFNITAPVPVTGVRFASSKLTLYEGDLFPVSAEVIPENAANKNVTYTSSNPSVAVAPEKGGFATAKSPGTTVITARTEDGGFTATMTVTVKKKETPESEKETPGSSKVVSKGKCGDNVKWELYENGLLYIYGEGGTRNYYNNYDNGYRDNHYYDSPFHNASSIIKVIVSDKITSIGQDFFEGCSQLTEISLPDSLTSIGNFAFYGCSSLTEIKLPNSLTSIGELAFGKCSSLTEIRLPNSLTSIGEDAFKDCSSLTEIKLPDNLTSIEDGVFYYCSSLMEIKLPDNLTSIGDFAFLGCSSLMEIKLPDNLSSIGTNTFSGCSSLKEIKFSNSLTSISNNTFENCSSLAKLDFPDSLTFIGEYAFKGCSNLTEIKLPDSLTSIGESAFSDCSSLTEIRFPNSLTSIKGKAFYHCTSLKKLNLPDSLSSIEYGVFGGCSSLKEIKLPDKLSSIGTNAFSGCSSLKEIKFSNSLTSISNSAFGNCSSLAKLDFPDNLTSIGEHAFKDCSSLKEIKFSNSPTSIKANSFQGCSSLEKLDFQDDLSSINWDANWNAFSGCSSLKEINLPDSLTSIANGTFSGLSNLKKIKLPKNLTSVGYGAFWECSSLKEIKFPESLTSIDRNVFYRCYGLKKIVFTGNAPDIGSYAFYQVRATVIYPADNPTWTKAVTMLKGWKECSLTLIPDKSTLLKNCRITLSSSVLYTGKKLIPLINIDNGTVFLIKGIDYTLTFANNKNPGTATVIIKGKGIYTGKVKKTFRIVPPAPKWMTAARVPGRNFVKLTWKKVAGASGYVIQRRSRSESRWVVRKVITKGTTTAYTDINAQKGITWSYRICAYSRSGKRKIYSSWSTAYWKI